MSTCTYRFVLLALAGVLGWGQGRSTTLTGTVTDPSGAVVPRVKVDLVNVDTGEDWRATTNESGNYFLPLVKPGRYRLTGEAPGFKQYQQTGIVLETGVPAHADFRLEIGALTESVTVEASLPLLQGGTSAVGMVIDNRTLATMALPGRRASSLVQLNGFVAGAALAGGRGNNTNWLIDGGSAQFVSLGTPTLAIDPPVESLQEFNVSVSNYAAELGRTGGGVVQMTTRSGTNQFHGSAYEFLRNDKLDARNFFAAEDPTLRYNLFGTSLGGPLRRNKAHFFFNYEGLRSHSAAPRILNVPDPAETRGDFSRSRAIIRDPLAAGRPPFQGNVIPLSRLDPVGARLATSYPEPNVPGRPSGSLNFRRNLQNVTGNDNYVGRVDYAASRNDRIYGRLLAFTSRLGPLPIFPTPGTDPFANSNNLTRYNGSATWLHNLSPVAVNELRFTYSTSSSEPLPGGFDRGLAQQIGLRGTNPRFPPQVLVAGLSGLGVTGGTLDDSTTSQLINDLTYVRANHQLKFGYEWRSGAADTIQRGAAGGRFNFNELATGSSLASLLLGWAQLGVRNETFPLRYRSLTMAAFVQDDWKVSPRLTLNMGLRWDWDQPRWEELGNRQSSFDRFAINPISGTPGIVTFSGRSGLSKFAHNHDWNNFGPRFGFAWRAADNWVIRGGAALIFPGEYAVGYGFGNALGFTIAGNFVSPDNGLTPAFLLRNGLPPIPVPTEADLTPGFGAVPVGRPPANQAAFFETHNRRSGYLETFNFNIQRRVTANLLVEIGYLATLGHKLPSPNTLTENQVRPELMGPGNAQIRRPFPQFSNVLVINPAIGNSNYHGMNLRVEKRYSRGLQLQANYTWARFIDDVSSLSELSGGAAYVDVYNRRADRGLSGNHLSHRLVLGALYQWPIGSGKVWNLTHSLWRQLLGGWSTGFIASVHSGPPYGVIEQTNQTNSFSPAQRPNVAGDPRVRAGRSRGEQIAQWFDTSAFRQPPQFTFGNAGSTAGYGPGAITLDLSILKDFPLVEQHRLQFRTEMLNFPNHPNLQLQPQNLQRGNPAFGRINASGPGRIIQFGLRYSF